MGSLCLIINLYGSINLSLIHINFGPNLHIFINLLLMLLIPLIRQAGPVTNIKVCTFGDKLERFRVGGR